MWNVRTNHNTKPRWPGGTIRSKKCLLEDQIYALWEFLQLKNRCKIAPKTLQLGNGDVFIFDD